VRAGAAAAVFFATAGSVALALSLSGVAVAPPLRLAAPGPGAAPAPAGVPPDWVPPAPPRGHRRGVRARAPSPSDRVLAPAGGAETVRSWGVDARAGRASDGACRRTREGPAAAVARVDPRPRGTQLRAPGGDGQLYLWFVTAGARVVSVGAPEGEAWALAVAGGGDWGGRGGPDGDVSGWGGLTAGGSGGAGGKHGLAVEGGGAFLDGGGSGEVA
jgi:hypothetical protein